MKTYYSIKTASKYAEEDIYDKGCQPGTSTGATLRLDIIADTAADAIEKARAFIGAKPEDVLIGGGVGEEAAGRVDISLMETGDGVPADSADNDAWKAGRRRLWLADYVMYVEKITAADVDFTAGAEAVALHGRGYSWD